MFITDKLSTELNVNYMDLFNKSNEYNHSENRKFREDVRLHRVFLDKEIDFLACFALEFLKENNIDNGNKMNEVNIENLSDFADSIESERDDLVNQVSSLKTIGDGLREKLTAYRLITRDLGGILKRMDEV